MDKKEAKQIVKMIIKLQLEYQKALKKKDLETMKILKDKIAELMDKLEL